MMSDDNLNLSSLDPIQINKWTGQIRWAITLLMGFGMGGAWLKSITDTEISNDLAAIMTVVAIGMAVYSFIEKKLHQTSANAIVVSSSVASAHASAQAGAPTPMVVVPSPNAFDPSATKAIPVTAARQDAAAGVITPPLNVVRVAALIAALLFTSALPACVSPQVQQDINTLLQGSPASTMVSYVASLNPQVSDILTNVDAAIATNAPRVLAIACGVGSAANFVFRTTAILDPKLISADAAMREGQAFAALESVCPPNPPPANLADAARIAFGAYQQIVGGTQAAGVAL